MRIFKFSRPTRPLWTIAAIASLAWVGYEYYQGWVSENAKHPPQVVRPIAQVRPNGAPFTTMAQAVAAQDSAAHPDDDNQTGPKFTPEMRRAWEMQASGLVKTPKLNLSPADGSSGVAPSPRRDPSGAAAPTPN